MSDTDWSTLPEWVMFTAVNWKGQKQGYEREPRFADGIWHTGTWFGNNSGMRYCHLTTVEPPDSPSKTLVKRQIPMFIRADDGPYLFCGYTSERLLEIASKLEELNAKPRG